MAPIFRLISSVAWRFFGQLFYFVRDHGKTFTRFPGAGSFDSGFQREQLVCCAMGSDDFD